jgi:hypothetical protein
LHAEPEAPVELHLSPHALQLVVVFSVVHVPLHIVSRHVQAPLLQSGFGCVHVAWFTHMPVPPHVSGVLPLQLT